LKVAGRFIRNKET